MNKKLFIRIILSASMLIACFSTCNAQLEKNHYQYKVDRYKGMRTTGRIIGITGIASIGAGIACIATAGWVREVDYYGYTTFEPTRWGQFGVGIGLAVFGVPPTALGIILASVGNSKVKRYTEKLKNVTLMPMGNRMYLCYRF